MASAIAGYRVLDRVPHAGRRSVVYRAVREADGLRVVIKLPSGDHPSDSQLDQIRFEHDLLTRLEHPQVVQVVELARHRNALALVTREVPGQALASLLATRGPQPVDAFLTLAVRLTKALVAVHAAGVIHKDLNPSNLVVDGEDIVIIDFGIASVLAREDQGLQSPAALEATLAYMSPEQTGRMNRPIDQRADLYALGATFFHMLVGEPPFRTTDPVELVHRHIATAPDPVHQRRPEVPEPVSRIIGRLLAKMADERYQSAAGLLADLKRCQQAFRTAGRIPPFELGTQDVSTRFQIPVKLYGRQDEVGRLLGAFRPGGAFPSGAAARPPLVLVTGPSGIGKSRLVREILRPLAGANGYFAAGKFDQLARGTPFASPIAALRGLLRLVLAEQDDRLAAWRARLTDALAPNAAVVTELLPELEALIGPQAPAPELPPQESRNRFTQVFRQFLGVFAQPEHPLVLFLDDLQWIDPATLAWLSDVLLDDQLGGLLVIGCYRSDEVDGAHPLSDALSTLQSQGVEIERIALSPLTTAHVGELVADALHAEPHAVADLAALVHAKTAGNPFFVAQLLERWARDGIVWPDPAGQGWSHDLSRARASHITDNVVDLMIGRIQEMSPDAQECLQLAACVGSTFDLETLLRVTGQPRDAVRALLFEALERELVVQVTRADEDGPARYRFQHDRVQQAAYAMLSDEQARAARLTVGRRMREGLADPSADDALFTILRHLNFARAEIVEPQEREELARLNLVAANRARRATAYGPAYEHVEVARELGPAHEAAWAFALACEHAECAHLTGRAEEAEAAYDEALRHAPDDPQRARVYESRVHFLTNHARFEEAYRTAREGAAHFGIDMPARFVPPLLLADLARTALAFAGKTVEELEALPVMTDPAALAGTRLASVALKAAYQVSPELAVANAARLLRVCLTRGNYPESALAYLVGGPIFQGGVLGRHGVGFDWGQLALRLVERFDHAPLKAEVRFVVAYFAVPWRQTLAETEQWFRQAWAHGIETGDLFHAGCASTGLLWNRLTQGVPLPELVEACEERIRFLRRVGNVENLGTLLAIRQAARCLAGETRSAASFNSEDFDEAEFEASLAGWGSGHFAHIYFVVKLMTLVLWGERARASEVARLSEGYLSDSVGLQHTVEHHVYAGLAAADRLAHGDDGPRGAWMRTLRGSARKLARWATENPANYRHKAELLAAELARVRGRTAEAFRRYDQAIEEATQRGYLHDQAIIRHRASEAYARAGRLESARLYRREAAAAYARWGALGLVEHLGGAGAGTTGSTVSVTTTGPGVGLDMAALMRSAQAISGEVRLSSLLERLLGVLIENAGASRGIVIVLDRGEPQVAAVGTPDEVALPGVPLSQFHELPASVVRYVLRTREPLLLEDAAADPRFASDPWVTSGRARSILCTPLVDQRNLKGLVVLENHLTTGAFTPARVELVTLLAGQIAISMDKATLYDRLEDEVRDRTAQLERRNGFIRQVFGRYLSDDVVDSLLESPQGLVLGGEKRVVTILMSDLRGFTPLTESLPPEEVVALINNYLSEMTRVILKYRGTIDEFIGDAILVLFGAPFAREDDAERALACAIEMQQAMEQVNAFNRQQGLPEVEMGVGLATGEVVVGNLGSERRAKYGVVGRSVNLAARIESLTVGGQVLAADSTLARVRAQVRVKQSFPFSPKGVQRPVQVHEVTGLGAPWDLSLSAVQDPLIALEGGVPVRFSVLAGKVSSEDWQSGTFVALSSHEALLDTELPLDTLANLRIRLVDTTDDDDLYAKVVGQGDRITVRFTSVPATARARLDAALAT